MNEDLAQNPDPEREEPKSITERINALCRNIELEDDLLVRFSSIALLFGNPDENWD